MKSYRLRTGVAEFLDMPADRVRVIYMDGPQVYGRTAADDAGFEAAWLAHKLGRPVRVQWSRAEETAWDTKGPAYTFRMRGGLDNDGNVTAIEYDACALDYNHVGYNEPDTVLIAQLMGRRPATPAAGRVATPSVQYGIRNMRTTGRIVGLPMIWETPLRTGNLRDPNGPQVTFAYESFIDELAAAAGADPVRFRLALLEASEEDDAFRRARSIAALKAAAETYGIAFHRSERETPYLNLISGFRYVDRFERRDVYGRPEWRIAARFTVVEWSRVDERAGRWPIPDDVRTGRRDRTDILYEVLRGIE